MKKLLLLIIPILGLFSFTAYASPDQQVITTQFTLETNLEKQMKFGQALEALEEGAKVAREGWNGKNMWLILVPGSAGIRPVAGTPYSNAGLTEEININPHIDMFTADGAMQPGWLASQTDMLAHDWEVV